MGTTYPRPPKKPLTRWQKVLLAIVCILIVVKIAGSGEGSAESESSPKSNYASNESQSEDKDVEEKISLPTIGEGIRTDYFDIYLHKYSLNDYINTGNQFASLEPQQNIKYLVITATWRNTDSESRMIDEGSVFLNIDGKEYEYDQTEPIMLEGWGAMLQQINPLTNYSTRLVYKIPADVKGTLYWEPGRNSDNTRFLLGEI